MVTMSPAGGGMMWAMISEVFLQMVALFVASRMHRTLLAHMLHALHTSVVLKVKRILSFLSVVLDFRTTSVHLMYPFGATTNACHHASQFFCHDGAHMGHGRTS